MGDYLGKDIPKLGFGLMRLPKLADGKNIDIEETKRMVDAFLAAGMKYFDTAYVYDGGLSDPIPFRKAFESGADKVVAIITRPRDFYRKKEKDKVFAKLMKQYPAIRKALYQRAELYNRQLDEAKNLEREGKVLILAPDTIGTMTTLKRDREGIMMLYEKGMKDAEKIEAFLHG